MFFQIRSIFLKEKAIISFELLYSFSCGKWNSSEKLATSHREINPSTIKSILVSSQGNENVSKNA